MVIHGGVAVFVQQLLHSTERDGSKVTRVLQLEETLQVRCCLTASYIHPLAVDGIQPKDKYILIKWQEMLSWPLEAPFLIGKLQHIVQTF